jgi:hypothetical protein
VFTYIPDNLHTAKQNHILPDQGHPAAEVLQKSIRVSLCSKLLMLKKNLIATVNASHQTEQLDFTFANFPVHNCSLSAYSAATEERKNRVERIDIVRKPIA